MIFSGIYHDNILQIDLQNIISIQPQLQTDAKSLFFSTAFLDTIIRVERTGIIPFFLCCRVGLSQMQIRW